MVFARIVSSYILGGLFISSAQASQEMQGGEDSVDQILTALRSQDANTRIEMVCRIISVGSKYPDGTTPGTTVRLDVYERGGVRIPAQAILPSSQRAVYQANANNSHTRSQVDPAAIGALRELVKDQRPESRILALALISLLGEDAADATCVNIGTNLHLMSGRELQLSLEALSHCTPATARRRNTLEALLRAAKDDSAAIQIAAIEGLATFDRLGDTERATIVSCLEPLLERARPPVRACALSSLLAVFKSDPVRAKSLIRDALNKPDHWVIASLVRFVCTANHPEFTDDGRFFEVCSRAAYRFSAASELAACWPDSKGIARKMAQCNVNDVKSTLLDMCSIIERIDADLADLIGETLEGASGKDDPIVRSVFRSKTISDIVLMRELSRVIDRSLAYLERKKAARLIGAIAPRNVLAVPELLIAIDDIDEVAQDVAAALHAIDPDNESVVNVLTKRRKSAGSELASLIDGLLGAKEQRKQ